jgi:hypothetical protein
MAGMSEPRMDRMSETLRVRSLRPARGHHELDFDGVRRVELDNGAHVSSLEATPWDVVEEHDGLERLEGHTLF